MIPKWPLTVTRRAKHYFFKRGRVKTVDSAFRKYFGSAVILSLVFIYHYTFSFI